MAGSFSASAASSACRGASLARRSLLPVRYLSNFRTSVTLLQLSAMWRVCHVCKMGYKKKRMGDELEKIETEKKGYQAKFTKVQQDGPLLSAPKAGRQKNILPAAMVSSR